MAVGGPLLKNRTFWFADYEGLREGLGKDVSRVVKHVSYETTDPTVDSQIIQLKDSGASAVIVLETRSVKIAALLALTVWSFARVYYFAFYVIERYVDPGYRFAGLWSFVRYATRHRRRASAENNLWSERR